MANEHSGNDISLEERKFAFDREMQLQRNLLNTRELELKENDARRSRWLNPTVIGLIAAASGLFGNMFVALVSSSNSQRIEQFKAQSNLIVQAVGTGDQKSACRNLISFIRLGLLDDPEGRLGKCETDLNAIPVLPSGSTYTPVLDTPSAVSMAPVVTAVAKDDHYHYEVGFTVPVIQGLLTSNPINLITVYSYKANKSCARSDDREYTSVKGNWKSGDRVTVPIDIPKTYVDDTEHTTFVRYCVGSIQGCVPGPNILLPATPSLPASTK
ncbi:hypothetical protein DFR50_12184 [Roseiarcus fermentans]|uniref:Uncharacterized protein n=1 Tax=Roseiarcus fermentans TaxID=1473586 RepID=A0A366F512_9HYPH|nr:hypothetical protein [Roseiarcus fermentans]RBP09738.1 hypothetical protein DFR50_12184 [Roseiarcus fermentans]